ncbi:hypothetical protein E1I21_05615 [Microbacterium oleivorans]|uniref:hypothetical protein n=1 Tax=Microbacterium oleivorans TaxID=273677 RepID=UPI0010A3A35B|nr:hypothetical protein [Microbacterium oleivorans]THE07809.1 hypothetical protein E1I21_05615 [Microbacterium oleivorans]
MTVYVQWDREAHDFRPVASERTPPQPSAETWWTSTSRTSGDRAAARVTHLGDRSSAEFRAQVNAQFVEVTGLFEVELPADLAVLDEIYLENHGEGAMQAFGQKLLASDADAAFYWNEKEAEGGAWSLIVRRDFLGELPSNPGPRVQLISQFSASSINREGQGLPQIEWI